MDCYLLAIDQGTTSSRAVIFDRFGKTVSQHNVLLNQQYPHPGWVEQDPLALFASVLESCRKALAKANIEASQLKAVGISNQRETTILWHKETGKPIYPAIGWQDRRTSAFCQKLSQTPFAGEVENKTGLLLDPYFSATKIVWLLENVPNARELAERGEILFGTVDCYLLWRLTKGQVHLTDITNASRTMLFNIHSHSWDEELLARMNIPMQILPQVKSNTHVFGEIHAAWLGHAIPVTGMAGDQQAAAIGQACFHAGMMKVTYGTGCFMLLNTGQEIIKSKNKLLSTIAYQINNVTAYGIEGSIFSAGNIVKWLRDALKMTSSARETERLAKSVETTEGVYLVPAFTGLGAPYWDPTARAAILGMTLNTQIEHIVRAGLESVCYQTRDLLAAMLMEESIHIELLRVDGGMVENNWLLQFLADILDRTVERPVNIETTALGAAYLAGLQVGIFSSLEEISTLWQMDSNFIPHMQQEKRELLYLGWKKAVARVLR